MPRWKVDGQGRLVPYDWRPPPSPASVASRRYRSSPEWRKLRAQVIAEEPACRDCGSTADPTVDHIVPLARGGSHDRSDCRRLCRRCNGRRSAALRLR